jgi:hypothetical protein
MVLLLEPVCVHGDEIAGEKHVPDGKMTAGARKKYCCSKWQKITNSG